MTLTTGHMCIHQCGVSSVQITFQCGTVIIYIFTAHDMYNIFMALLQYYCSSTCAPKHVCLLTVITPSQVTALEWFYMSAVHNVFCSSAMELTEIRTKYVHGNRLAALLHVYRLWYTWSSKLNTNVHSNNSLDSLMNVNLTTVTALHHYFTVQSTHPRLRCCRHTFHLFPLSLMVFLAACKGHTRQ